MKITPSIYSFAEPAARVSTSGNVSTTPADDWQAKRLKKMQEALAQLKAMPTPQQAQKEAAKEKLAFLIERLRELKAMLLHATPAQAKSIASQLKSIASQISSIAKLAGSGGGGSSGGGQMAIPSISSTPSASANASAASSTTASTAAAVPTQADTAEASNAAPDSKATSDTPKDLSVPADDKSQNQTSLKSASSPSSDDDKGLKALLEEAKKLLREVANLLKSKLAQKDKDAKSDMQAVDRSIADIDASTTNLAYGGLGNLIADINAGSASGLNINTTA